MGKQFRKQAKYLLLVLLVSACTSKHVMDKNIYSGDYPTLQIREMWHVCSLSFQQKAPQTPFPEMMRMCDCYVDHMRKNFPSKSLNNLSISTGKSIGEQLNLTCNVRQNLTGTRLM
ncbi:MAG: hypothetical protein ISR93_10605 [SAR324 cluster bacterium]|nr:hypothetical protein [SAR324 cluster bacterium]